VRFFFSVPFHTYPFSDHSKRVAPSPKKAQSTGPPQSVSGSHPPASYRPAPSPPQLAQPNLDRSTSQRTAPKPPRGDTLARANTTKDRRSPAAPAAVKAPPRDSPNASTADLPSKSQTTTTVNPPVSERRAPQPPAPSQQQSTVASNLAKAGSATPRRREKKKEDKANDADIVKRLQQICTDADPTRLYRNLVKIGQGSAHRNSHFVAVLLTFSLLRYPLPVVHLAVCLLPTKWGPTSRLRSSKWT
jgi:p21-activated kinase 1